MKQEQKQYYQLKDEEVTNKLEQKNDEIILKDQKIVDLQRKIFKIKLEKDNIIEYL